MANRRGRGSSRSPRSLRDELREFVLENVEVSEEERVLGTGSYGSVQEVKISGEVYAAKMIHEVLLETDERGGAESVADKYREECRLMSRMRHPNITQFIGVCFLGRSRLPLLVMERLECSVDELVETTPPLPLSVCVYILTGVCRGLLHLHRKSVVHRDLTARNILLTASLKAKITDFGNSRIVRMEPGRLARTLTRFPGTLVYMPPEAVSEHGQYGPSLDVFSFGVLMLFVLTQVFPGDLLSPTYPNPNNPDLLLGRSEFERRSVYTAHLERKLIDGRESNLFGVVRECLSNNPERRPTTSDLFSSLEGVGTEMDGGLLLQDIARVKTARSLRAKEQRIEELQRELTRKNHLLTEKDTQLAEKDTQIAARDTGLVRQREAFQAELTAKDDIFARKNRELEDNQRQLTQKNSVIAEKEAVIAEKEATIAESLAERERALAEREALIETHRKQIGLKDAELARRAVLIQQLEEMVHSRDHVIQKRGSSAPDDPPQELRPPLTLKWRRGKDMPIKMGCTIQSVIISDCVYVGGGRAGNNSDSCTVMKLDLQRDEWTKLPQYRAKYFAMTSLNNQLVLVGGYDAVTVKSTNQIAMFESGKWTHPYPLMNIARHSSTAVCFNNHIIVAGGEVNQYKCTSSVEVLDVTSRKWHIAESLPHPLSLVKFTLAGHTLYLMGGWDHTGNATKVVHKVDLNELTRKAVSKQATPTLWQVIEDTPLYPSAPLSVGGSLLAVGGRDDCSNSNSSIHLYQLDTRRWVKVGDLPTARYFCTCSVLPSGEVIVAGGETGWSQLCNTVEFVSIS